MPKDDECEKCEDGVIEVLCHNCGGTGDHYETTCRQCKGHGATYEDCDCVAGKSREAKRERAQEDLYDRMMDR